MAAVILVLTKPARELPLFFKALDPYITSQGFVITDNMPKTYFTEGNIPPNIIRNIVHTIKNTNHYNKVVRSIYFSTNLTKG